MKYPTDAACPTGSSSSSSSSSSSGGGNCCGGCGSCGGVIKCGVLGLLTSCPPGGVLSTGGTPADLTAMLDAYAKLINAFNGSPGGQDILKQVANKLAGMQPVVLNQQSEYLATSKGSQFATLATLGKADKQAVVAVINDTMYKNSATLTGAVQDTITRMRNEYARTDNPAKQAALLKHINNALQVKTILPRVASKIVLDPFRDARGNITLTPEQMATAVVDLASINKKPKHSGIFFPSDDVEGED